MHFLLAGKFSFKRLPLTLLTKYKCVIFDQSAAYIRCFSLSRQYYAGVAPKQQSAYFMFFYAFFDFFGLERITHFEYANRKSAASEKRNDREIFE